MSGPSRISHDERASALTEYNMSESKSRSEILKSTCRSGKTEKRSVEDLIERDAFAHLRVALGNHGHVDEFDDEILPQRLPWVWLPVLEIFDSARTEPAGLSGQLSAKGEVGQPDEAVK